MLRVSALVLHLAIALLMILVGVWVIAARPRENLNRVLGVLLLLLAGSTMAFARYRAAANPEEVVTFIRLILWYEVPAVFLMVLLADQLFFPRPRPLWAKGVLVGTGILSTLLLVALAVDPGAFTTGVYSASDTPFHDPGVLSGVQAVAFLGAEILIVALAAWHVREPGRQRLRNRRVALVGLAFGVLVAHTGALLLVSNLTTPGELVNHYRLLAITGLAATVVSLPRLSRCFETRGRIGFLLAGLLPVLLGTLDGLQGPLRDLGVLPPDYRNSRPVLLAAFALALGVAVVRYGLAGFGQDARDKLARRTGWVAVLTLAGAGFGVALVRLGLTPGGLAVGALAALAPLALPLTPLRRVPGLLMDRLLIDPDDTALVSERVRLYTSALRGAVAPGGDLQEDKQGMLEQLRREMGLTQRDHEVLLALITAKDPVTGEDRLLMDRYAIEAEIAEGGTATVFQARDVLIDRPVVVKVLEQSAENLRRVITEMRALGKLDHPRVVTLYNAERVGDKLVLVLEHVPGGTLETLIDERGPLKPAAAAHGLITDVLDALEAVHEAGLVHGDVKTTNVYLDAENRATLGDFGAARVTVGDAGGTATVGPVEATLAAMAPEQVVGGDVTERTDVYATGALLYRLLTGENYLELEELTEARAFGRILDREPGLETPYVPTSLVPVLRTALAKAPADRYPDVRRLREAIDEALAGPPITDGDVDAR